MKSDFPRSLAVIKIRAHYKGPYHKKSRLYLDKDCLKSKKKFISYLNNNVFNWSNGRYTLKCLKKITPDSKTKLFARFEVKDGKVVELIKASDNKSKFLCWEYFDN